MSLAAVTAYVKNLLDGLAMPGPNALAMQAYITPPDPRVDSEYATAYIWPAAGEESRNPAQGGTIPRNTGPGTPSGWKPVRHMIDIYIVWFQADDDPLADSLFPAMVDAVMAALRTSGDSAALHDPYTQDSSTLYNLGEDIHYQTDISALADEAYNRLDALLRCPAVELIQA